MTLEGKAVQMPRRSVTLLALFLMLSSVLLVTGCPPSPPDKNPQARFTASPREGNAMLEVQFTDTSSGEPGTIYARIWDFGDGTQSTAINPKHRYREAGSYTVSLTVYTGYGENTATYEDYIVVTEPTAFQVIGPEGGTAASQGVSLTLAPKAVRQDVAVGIRCEEQGFQLHAEEALQVISSTFTVMHDNTTDLLFASSDAQPVQPAVLTLPFARESLPEESQNGENVFVLAYLAEEGVMIPVPAQVEGDTARIEVTHLPASAQYVVVYRLDGREIEVEVPLPDAKVVNVLTQRNWPNVWRMYLSTATLQQMTALRMGTLATPSVYNRRNFTEDELQDTIVVITDALQLVQQELMKADFRAPVLVNCEDTFALTLYNMNQNYTSEYEAFRKLKYRDYSFGSVVIDPIQLLMVALSNARDLEQDTSNTDIAQELSFANAFTQTLFEACFDGYGYPAIEENDPLDVDILGTPGKVDFLDGFKLGLSTAMGQKVDELPYARAFGDNEYVALDLPFLAPTSPNVAGYAVANQDFFFYLFNALTEKKDGQEDGDIAEVQELLEAIRLAFADEPDQGFGLDIEGAVQLTYRAIDDALLARQPDTGGLPMAYWFFVRDMAVENTTLSRIRPSDESRTALTLNEDRFSKDQVVHKALIAPKDRLEVSSQDTAILADIPPLTSRIVQLQVHPLATSLTLGFNSDDWSFDNENRALTVQVYAEGKEGLSLLDGTDENYDMIPDTIVLDDFKTNLDDCYVNVYVLISNLSLVKSNSFAMTAQSEAVLDIPEGQVLDEFVSTCDPHYDWNYLGTQTIAVPGYDVKLPVHTLYMTSGAWRGSEEAAQSVWEHYLTIVEPPAVMSNTAMLMVSGGSTGNVPSQSIAQLMLPFSASTGSVVALLQGVPNQPQAFTDEERTRSEDAIIGYSYDKYLSGYLEGNADKTWPALLPMTRSAVRAMDAVQEFMRTEKPGAPITVEDFVMTGASKRGWTTWLSACTDSRVKAIMPIVIDVLNMSEQMAHHYRSYGYYSDAIKDYEEARLIGPLDDPTRNRIAEPEGQSLLKIVDPFSYRERLTMPKLVLNSTGDQFFLPDSSRFYFDQLPGENYLYYAPNTDHSMTGGTALSVDSGTLEAMQAYYISLLSGAERPKFTWRVENNNTRIVVETETQPKTVRMWTANNRNERDFRLEVFGENWHSTILEPVCDDTEGETSACESGVYVAQLAAEDTAQGWTAFFVQLVFEGPETLLESVDYRFSTNVVVTPDTYPVHAE